METTAIGAALAAMPSAAATAEAAPAAATLPTITLGRLKVSRLILGSNPFFGFGHQSPDLDEQMKAYFTDARICAVLDQAADLGITAVAAPVYPRWIELFNKYVSEGGRLRIWIAQPDPEPAQMKQAITQAAKGGAKAVFIQGARVDEQFDPAGKLDVLRDWMEHIKSYNLPAGMASHKPVVHLAAEQAKLPTDFYYQCFFQPDTYRPEDREKAVAALKQIEKPVVGYKILAAGRIPAEEGFAFAFRHLRRKDGVCVGMFPRDKATMIAENAALLRKHASRAGEGVTG